MTSELGIAQTTTYADGSTRTLYRYRVVVVGGIWMPYGARASYEYRFEAENNEDAASRVDSKAGDFSSVDDFEMWVWGELCSHCHNQGWILVKEFTPEGQETYFDTLD